MSISMRFTVLKLRVRIHPIRLLAGSLLSSLASTNRSLSRSTRLWMIPRKGTREKEREIRRKFDERWKGGRTTMGARTCLASIVGPITFHAQRYSSDHEPKRFRCIIYIYTPTLKILAATWIRDLTYRVILEINSTTRSRLRGTDLFCFPPRSNENSRLAERAPVSSF